MRQVGPAVEREQFHGRVTPVLDDRADAVGIDHVDVQGIFDRFRELLSNFVPT